MIQAIAKQLHTIAQMIVKRIKRFTRPANSSLASDLIIGVTRSKRDLILENALLRQQLIVLKRGQKRVLATQLIRPPFPG